MDEICEVLSKVTLERQLDLVYADVVAAQDSPRNQPFIGFWALHASLQ